jgi:hypothetical protein
VTIKANLKVGAVANSLEHEAVRVADQVMRTPDPHAPVAIAVSPNARQAGAACQDEDRLQVEPAGLEGADNSKAPAVVREALRSPGRPLDNEARNLLGPRFGTDFAEVRVHCGPLAEQSARAIGARAYTVGKDIVLGAGPFSPATPDGRRLLAHELTHVVQQAGVGPSVQRQPYLSKPDARPETKSPKAPAKNSDPTLSPFVSADMVRELRRDNDAWTLTIDSFFRDPDSVRRLIWPSRVPPGVTITLDVAILEPVEMERFVLKGVTFDTLKTMEPSFAKLFSAHGLEDESKEGVAVQNARAAFRDRHKGHGDWVLNSIDFALKRITKRNPELLIAYYNYYAKHELRDEKKFWQHRSYEADTNTGDTEYGDTLINRRVLWLTSEFPSNDPTSLLAGTLIHEYVHTPQGGGESFGSGLPKEAKAYGIELFFSERMGDTKRAEHIINYMSSNDPLSNAYSAGPIFNKSYRIMRALYESIDQGGPAAKNAREMSVEFISKNSTDFGAELKAFIAKTP